MSTNNTLWVPPLSSRDQKLLNKQRGRRWQKVAKWTGFSDKTLWDWLQLLAALAIPVVIAAGTLWFSPQQNEASSRASDQQHKTDLQVAQDQQQENALQIYLDRMSDLLLNSKLRESRPMDEVRNVARAKTLTVLRQLDPLRKGFLIKFLYEAALIRMYSPIISLQDADLSSINFGSNIGLNTSSSIYGPPVTGEPNHCNLSGINLQGADLKDSSFKNADLSRAFLAGAYLGGADLSGANLSGANLSLSLQPHLDQHILPRNRPSFLLENSSCIRYSEVKKSTPWDKAFES